MVVILIVFDCTVVVIRILSFDEDDVVVSIDSGEGGLGIAVIALVVVFNEIFEEEDVSGEGFDVFPVVVKVGVSLVEFEELVYETDVEIDAEFDKAELNAAVTND